MAYAQHLALEVITPPSTLRNQNQEELLDQARVVPDHRYEDTVGYVLSLAGMYGVSTGLHGWTMTLELIYK